MTLHHTDLVEFVDAVADMRRQQRRFFNAGVGTVARREALRASQAGERKVDKMLAALMSAQERMDL